MSGKILWLGAVLTVALASAASAQPVRTNVYSRPQIPSREVLQRLNLNLAWRYYVPLDGKRDGILRVDIDGKDLFVLTRAGQVARLDAETGKVLWRTSVAKPYTMLPFLAANSRSVYVIANVELFSLDRETGFKKWDYRLPAGVSASPVVDDQQIYVPAANTRLYAYYLPFVTLGGGRGGGEDDRGGLYSQFSGRRDRDDDNRPRPTWSEQTNINLTFRPLQTADVVFVVSREGRAMGISKTQSGGGGSKEIYRLSTEGQISQQPGQYGDTAYVGSDDAALYAVNILTGKLRWRHTAGSAVLRRPVALDRDVFVTSEREGMARLDRRSGDSQWKIPSGRRFTDASREADEFLAANDRFVYASDRAGRLLILDRKRGVTLSMLDTSAYRVKVVNEVTDRLYLAANDGLIVCLHDRDVKEPIRHRRQIEEAASPVLKLLAQKIKPGEGKELTLRGFLEQLRAKYKLKFVVAERAFREADNAGVQDKKVTPPGGDERTLKDYLQRTLDQVTATYQVVDETILITPAKAKPKEKEKEKGKDNGKVKE